MVVLAFVLLNILNVHNRDGRDRMVVGSITMQSVRIPLKRVFLNTTLCENFISDLWQVVCFLRVVWFPPPIKLTAMI